MPTQRALFAKPQGGPLSHPRTPRPSPKGTLTRPLLGNPRGRPCFSFVEEIFFLPHPRNRIRRTPFRESWSLTFLSRFLRPAIFFLECQVLSEVFLVTLAYPYQDWQPTQDCPFCFLRITPSPTVLVSLQCPAPRAPPKKRARCKLSGSTAPRLSLYEPVSRSPRVCLFPLLPVPSFYWFFPRSPCPLALNGFFFSYRLTFFSRPPLLFWRVALLLGDLTAVLRDLGVASTVLSSFFDYRCSPI